MKWILTLASFLFIFTQELYSQGHTLSVTGHSSVFQPADKLTLTLGVETYDKIRKQAVHDNAEKMSGVYETLKAIGLTENEMQTKNFSITPQLSSPPKNPPANWMAEIVGYRVQNILEIRTIQLDKVGEIIDTATTAGINYIEQMVFSLQDEEQAKIDAINKAYNQAEKYAKSLAHQAGVSLGDIRELSITNTYMGSRSFASLKLGGEAQTHISPQEVEITASVSIIFNILH